MKYTMKGKAYTEFDINNRCAEIMGIAVTRKGSGEYLYLDKEQDEEYNPLHNPSDTDAIIDKVWDELNESILRSGGRRKSHWQDLMHKHNCTKLKAACILCVELYEVGNE